MLDPFKARFFDCMRLLYPDGVVSHEQLRDLIRVFSIGWVEALMLNECVAGVEAWAKDYKHTTEEGWFPDDSWKWWLGNN
jgi:hypothetical protein